MARVVVRPAARRDLIHHFAYLGERASIETARRFLDAARTCFSELAESPGMGSRRQVGKFADIRMWRIRGFEKCLIFYKTRTDGVQIERVIHCAQDYTRVIGR
jgi:toxin ParE1/3/4